MKLPNFYKKQIIPFMSWSILSLFIWQMGPATDKRFYIIAALFLLWMLKVIFFDIPLKKNKFPSAPLSAETLKKLQALQGRFQGALDFLKKTIIQKNGAHFSLSNLPWYLLIGPPGSGKTALLTEANIPFILSKQNKAEPSLSDSCDWWITREAVIVDIPGSYFSEKTSGSKTPLFFHHLWKRLLILINVSPSKEKLKGIVIALNLPELMKKPGLQQQMLLAHHLKKRILELRSTFGSQIPFQFIITKCDLLPGFLEFFGENTRDELAQTWGITIPSPQGKNKLVDILAHRFNVLIKRINKQLISRLHHERNPNARPYIKDFPLHIERLKEAVITLTKALVMPDLHLTAIYLTSATQPSAKEDAEYINTSTNHQALDILHAPTMPSKAYFLHQLMLQSLVHMAHDSFPLQNHHGDRHWQERAIYAASIGIIVTAALLLGHDFRQSIQKTYAIENNLSHYQLAIQQENHNGDRLIKALPLLESLQQAAYRSAHTFSRLESILSFYSNRSQKTAESVYQQALKTIVLPEIKNDLEKYLKTANTKNPAIVYTALKAYLMLMDISHRDPGFIAHTLSKIAIISMNKPAQRQLASHIQDAFTQTSAQLELDQHLIAEVRKQLTNLPSTELAFVILKNIDTNNADSTISLGTNAGSPPVFVSQKLANHIPNMFIADHFQHIMSSEIADAAREALKGNWVLGQTSSSLNQLPLETLTTQLRRQYVANYIDIWESQLANIQPFTPKNLLQTDEMIQNLTNNDSPLLQLLQTIKQNTSIEQITTASPKIQALNTLLISTNDKPVPLYQIFVSLRQLHTYLQTILITPDLNQAAFNAAESRMQHSEKNPITDIHELAEQSPEPLKNWLNTIANQSWIFILEAAGEHIENAWQTDILPIYQKQFLHHYPFNQTSKEEVDLQQFSDFLGHKGKLASFYQTYLKPFIQDENGQWTWKSVDNRRILFSNKLLLNLQHAAQIQDVFFPNGDNKLAVRFSLQPVSLDASLKSITVNINGQFLSYQKNAPRIPKILTWPGNNAAHLTRIDFITSKHQFGNSLNKGDWSWFRLVSHAIQDVGSKKELLLNVNTNGHSVKYLLFTQGHLNPFLPINLSRFELPEEIIEAASPNRTD